MSAADTWAGIAQVATLVLLLVVAYRPVGDWMARVYTPTGTPASSAASTA